MSAAGVRAGKAFVEILADNTGLVRGLNVAAARLKAFGAMAVSYGQSLAVGSAAVLGPLLASAKAFADTGSLLQDLSERTGESAEELSALSYAAEQSGSGLEDLEKGIRGMQRTLAEAKGGSASAAEQLKELGLTIEALTGLGPAQQFRLIADRIAAIEDPALRTATAMAIFGKSGSSLLPLMLQGAKGIEELEDRARRLGLVMSKEDAAAAAELGDTLDTLWRSIKMTAVAIGASFAPELNEAAKILAGVARGTAQWIREHKELVVMAFKGAVAVGGLGVSMWTLGKASGLVGGLLGYTGRGLGVVFKAAGLAEKSIIGLVRGFGWLLTATNGLLSLTGLKALFSGLLASAKGLATGGIAGLKAALAALATPAGQATVILSGLGLAVAGLAGYSIYASGVIGVATESWAKNYASFGADATRTIKGVTDALMSGDFALAGRVAMAGLQLEWQRGVLTLQEIWQHYRTWLLGAGTDLWAGFVSLANDGLAALEVAWVEVTAGLSSVWTRFTGWLMQSWNSAVGFLQKAWIRFKSWFDESIDVEAATQKIDQGVASANAQSAQQTGSDVAAIEQRAAARRQRIERDRAGAELAINQDADTGNAQRAAHAKETISAAEKALADARAEWEKATREAASKRAAIDQDAGARPRTKDLDLDGIAAAVDSAAQRTRGAEVRGTFSAAAVGRRGAGGPSERIAQATEATARGVQKLVQEAQHGQLVFAS